MNHTKDSDQEAVSRRVLVVDDNFPFRSLAQSLLTTRGFEVKAVEDAAEALHCLQEQTYDLIFLDIRMPGMPGDELCRMIRRQLGMRTVPIVAYTADGLGLPSDAAEQAGFDALLLKPVSAAELDRILAEVLPVPSPA